MTDTTWLLIIFAAGIGIAEVGRFFLPYFNLYHNLSIILAVELILMELVISS